MESQLLEQTKQSFFEDNQNFKEIMPTKTSSVKGFQNIDEEEEEIWLLQIPKGMNVQELEGQKLKFPGRMKIDKYEAAALETATPKKLAFGYSHRHKYHLGILPIAGSIILREKIAAPKKITEDDLYQACPPVTVEMPEYIKLRHPLLGAKFDEYIKSCGEVIRKPSSVECSSKRKSTRATEPSPKQIKSIKVEKTKNIKTEILDVSEDLEWIKNL